jgi:hypothetical protein
VSPLERRCRWLLIAYPATYRHERGEEILGTLLEATPDSRQRPLARDSLALIAGGLRARAAENRRLTTPANLCLAGLVGVAIYLGLSAATTVQIFGIYDWSGPYAWSAWTMVALVAAAVALVWVGSRRALTCVAVAAAAAVAYYESSIQEPNLVIAFQLLCLAGLVLLARRVGRPSWAWLWLTGGVVVASTLPGYVQGVVYATVLGLNVGLCVVPLLGAWMWVDARPLLAVGISQVIISSVVSVDDAALGSMFNWFNGLLLLVGAAITGLALWRVRRQSIQATA